MCLCKKISIFYTELCKSEMTWGFLKMLEKEKKDEKDGGREGGRAKGKKQKSSMVW